MPATLTAVAMHEMSMAVEICRMAQEYVDPPGARILELGVEVGDDAGVELENLQFCLEALLSQPPFEGARLAMLRVSGDVLRLTYLEVDDDGPDD